MDKRNNVVFHRVKQLQYSLDETVFALQEFPVDF